MKNDDFKYSNLSFLVFCTSAVTVVLINLWLGLDINSLKFIFSLGLVQRLIYVFEYIIFDKRITKELEKVKLENEKFTKQLKEAIQDFY